LHDREVQIQFSRTNRAACPPHLIGARSVPIASPSSGLSKLPSFTRPEDMRAVAYQRLDHRLGVVTPDELAAMRRMIPVQSPKGT
jgi:hypothetical protein